MEVSTDVRESSTVVEIEFGYVVPEYAKGTGLESALSAETMSVVWYRGVAKGARWSMLTARAHYFGDSRKLRRVKDVQALLTVKGAEVARHRARQAEMDAADVARHEQPVSASVPEPLLREDRCRTCPDGTARPGEKTCQGCRDERVAATPWILWGWKQGLKPFPIHLALGSKRECAAAQKRYEGEGWLCGVYARGDKPEGLRLQVVERCAVSEPVVTEESPEAARVAAVYMPERKLSALRAIEAGKVRWSYRKSVYTVRKGVDASTRDVDWACGHGFAGHVEHGNGYRVELTTLGREWLRLLTARVEGEQPVSVEGIGGEVLRALEVIAANPRMVEFRSRRVGEMLRIAHSVERELYRAGLAAKDSDPVRVDIDPECTGTLRSYTYAWKLTDAGRAVVGGSEAAGARVSAVEESGAPVVPVAVSEASTPVLGVASGLVRGERRAAEDAERLVPQGERLMVRTVRGVSDVSRTEERSFVVGVVASLLRAGGRFTGADGGLIVRCDGETVTVSPVAGLNTVIGERAAALLRGSGRVEAAPGVEGFRLRVHSTGVELYAVYANGDMWDVERGAYEGLFEGAGWLVMPRVGFRGACLSLRPPHEV
ncbi:hypothetical protein [Streptomyces sp. NPDC088727]|uniref:hypothetical protein n=1 Tax=Streptomyces sp. NPDC088727 TaxID=3365875 RepID=UPI0037FB950A